jgi:hypothetical protein
MEERILPSWMSYYYFRQQRPSEVLNDDDDTFRRGRSRPSLVLVFQSDKAARSIRLLFSPLDGD